MEQGVHVYPVEFSSTQVESKKKIIFMNYQKDLFKYLLYTLIQNKKDAIGVRSVVYIKILEIIFCAHVSSSQTGP